MPQLGNHLGHFKAGQLSAFAGLGALRDLDLKRLAVVQIFRRHAKAPRGNLLDLGRRIVAIRLRLEVLWIFAAFTGMSIAQTFFATAIAFLGLSLYGYTTKKDLSGWGSFLIMGVIGLIVCSILNIWLQSSALSFAVSIIGILIFAGLTAYDTQRLKNEYLHYAQMGSQGAAYLAKGAIMGALSLYINFLNMFMFLLQFMGAARE